MTKKCDILIEEMDKSVWVAAIGEDGRLSGLEVDPASEQVRWGSIYWAKVARIDKAMDAAYVSLDGENIGILHNADVRIRQKDGTILKGGDKAIGKYIQPGEMIAVQAKSAYLPRPDDDMMPEEEKKPRVTMNIVLPGRYMLYAPFEPENRVSRRIRDKKLRKQLMSMLDTMEGLGNCRGCILRAAAADMQTEFLARESRILAEMWDEVQDHFEGDRQSLVMLGPDAVQRMLSDKSNNPIGHILMTTMDHYNMAETWCDIFAPDLLPKIEPLEMENGDDEFALFDKTDLIPQIESLFQPYAILPTGAAIIIQETAALLAIDVNRGADDRSNLAINLDAAAEIARQLRLRNLGGAVVIDFLKLGNKADYKKVQDALEAAFLENDPCTVQMHGLTGLGMIEISRQRRTPALLERYESTIS